MTVRNIPLGDDILADPLDYSREAIVEHGQRIITYATNMMDMAELRDDDAANLMRGRIVAELKVVQSAFEAIGQVRLAQQREQQDRAA